MSRQIVLEVTQPFHRTGTEVQYQPGEQFPLTGVEVRGSGLRVFGEYGLIRGERGKLDPVELVVGQLGVPGAKLIQLARGIVKLRARGGPALGCHK